MKHYIRYVVMGILLIFIGYEWVCGGVLWWWYQDTRTAGMHVVKGCVLLALYLAVLYRMELLRMVGEEKTNTTKCRNRDRD